MPSSQPPGKSKQRHRNGAPPSEPCSSVMLNSFALTLGPSTARPAPCGSFSESSDHLVGQLEMWLSGRLSFPQPHWTPPLQRDTLTDSVRSGPRPTAVPDGLRGIHGYRVPH